MAKFIKKKRKFIANKITNLSVTNVGKIKLKSNEHLEINFLQNKENEVCAMDWGIYATSSINKRLKNQNCSTYLTKNVYKKKFIMIVQNNKKKHFKDYCKKEKIKIIKKI